MFALGDRSALLFDFVERPIGVFAGRRAMAFDTSFAVGKIKKTIGSSERS